MPQQVMNIRAHDVDRERTDAPLRSAIGQDMLDVRLGLHPAEDLGIHSGVDVVLDGQLRPVCAWEVLDFPTRPASRGTMDGERHVPR